MNSKVLESMMSCFEVNKQVIKEYTRGTQLQIAWPLDNKVSIVIGSSSIELVSGGSKTW